MKMELKQILSLVLTLLVISYGAGSDGDSNSSYEPVGSGGFITPDYETSMELSDVYETDLSDITDVVTSQQSKGQAFAEFLENRDMLIDEDTVVQLIELYLKIPAQTILAKVI